MSIRLCPNEQVGKTGNNNNTNNNNNVSFTNGFGITDILRYADTEKALGATAVDVLSMCAPRTIVDTIRNPDMGVETFVRENSTCFFHVAIGLFGVAAAKLIGGKFKHDYNVDPSKLYANEDSIEACSHFFHKAVKENPNDKEQIVHNYLDNMFKNMKALNGENLISLGDAEHAADREDLVNTMKGLILKGKDPYNIPKDEKNLILTKLTHSIGARNSIEIELKNSPSDKGKIIKTSGELIFKDVYALGKSFLNEKVQPTFEKADKAMDSKFIKDLSRLTKIKTGMGLAVAALIAMNLQKINVWITKKRTGKEGFIGSGDDAKKADKSAGFKISKAISEAAMLALVVKSIAMGGKIRDIPRRVQFTSKIPHLDQYKVIYGLNLMGRIYSARNKDELRETNTRDFWGFANWLIFGGIVTKVVAKVVGGDRVINYKGQEGVKNKKINWDWIMNASVKSHDELAEPNLKDISTMYKDGKRQSYLKVLKNLKDSDLKGITKKQLIKDIKCANISQAVGIIYSILILGIGIPLLNEHVTEKKHKKIDNNNQDKTNKFAFMRNNKQINDDNKKTFANFAG